MANATVADILMQADAAAMKFNGPINTAMAIEEPSQQVVDCIKSMRAKRTEIYRAAEADILASPELDAALAALRNATANLNEVAQVMTDVTKILNKATEFLGYGTDAVKAIKSVSS